VGQEHVAHPNLSSNTTATPKGDPEDPYPCRDVDEQGFANDPAHLFTGTCNRPCALTLRHRTEYVDLSGFGSKIRWLVKQSGFHDVRPVLKLADGTYPVGDQADGWVDAFDWYVSEVLIASVRWRRLDPQNVVTIVGGRANAAGWVEKPGSESRRRGRLRRLDAGQGHGNGGFSGRGLIEVHGRPVALMRMEILRGGRNHEWEIVRNSDRNDRRGECQLGCAGEARFLREVGDGSTAGGRKRRRAVAAAVVPVVSASQPGFGPELHGEAGRQGTDDHPRRPDRHASFTISTERTARTR
jgi:hypothetical protein